MFSKQILSKKQILTTNQKEGKRGFRVYPKWAKTESKQAEETQVWQTKYFVDLTNDKLKIFEEFNSIINI